VEEEDCIVAQVVPLLKVRHLGDRLFDYLVPCALSGRVRVGSVVGVPFGRQSARAVVTAVGGLGDRPPSDLRSVDSLEEESVPQELLGLAAGLAEHYLASYESCLRLVTPPAAGRAQGRPRGPSNQWVTRTRRTVDPSGSGKASLEVAQDATPGEGLLTPKQRALLAAIPEAGGPAASICTQVGVGATVLRALVTKGLVELGLSPDGVATGLPGSERELEALAPRLSNEQEKVVRELVSAYESPGLSSSQLWGITGSGKTEVYLRLLGQAVEQGASAILLVPEIALTPQMIERVRSRFGELVGVLHSGLPSGERRREYARIAKGEATVVVGARSAVFAPVRDLRLVIIDESHDASYKQEEEPRYHARKVAQLRLERRGGLLLEGSATPAVENMADTAKCLRLSKRAAGQVPECETVDMRRQGGGQLLAPRTRQTIGETLRRGEQAIVLLNRRGYAGYVHCELCGHVMLCDECELSLTYHSRAHRLLCHHCGRSYTQPSLCPSCRAAPLVRAAPGTERLDEELHKFARHGQVFRLDSDVLTSGTRVRAVLEQFSATQPAVLVGTQMVAKGHDFPNVTLVVVADADTGLYVPDFRAAERTFQLLTQVAGRAGRGERPGRVLVQTWNPDVPCIRMALERDEKGFYSRELRIRERLGYPPFTDLIRMVTVGEHVDRSQLAAQHLAERLKPHFSARELRGPARLPSLRGRNRWHLLVAAGNGERARAIVGQAIAQLREPYRRRGVTLLVDVDPLSFG
jgi:primosomal protein N' (replication factor Y)